RRANRGVSHKCSCALSALLNSAECCLNCHRIANLFSLYPHWTSLAKPNALRESRACKPFGGGAEAAPLFPLLLALEQLAYDDVALDFAGAFVNLEDFHVAQQLRYRILFHETVAAEHLHGIHCGLGRHIRR